MTKIKSENKAAVITGDFNYDLLKYCNDANTEEFLNLFLDNFFQPLIFYPTRIIEEAKPSLIDNIFINNLESDTISGNIVNKISDHMPNFAIIKNSKKNLDISSSRMKRDYSNYDKENFLRQLSKEDLKDSINACSDVNNKFEIFHEHFMKTFEKHLPLKKISKTKVKQQQKPWITAAIRKSISIREKNFKKFIKTNNHTFYDNYKLYRNKINHLIRKSKSNYFKSYFERFRENSKKIWTGVNKILNKTFSTTQNIVLNQNGKIISNQKNVADEFNNFFINVGQNLSKKIKKSTKNPLAYIQKTTKSLFLSLITKDEVEKIINAVDSKKASDVYGIPIKIVKDSSPFISNILADIYSSSLLSGVFPNKLRLTYVIPAHKGNSKMSVGNYRPISIIPIFRKIFEKLIYARYMSFLNKECVLYDHQSGFRSK